MTKSNALIRKESSLWSIDTLDRYVAEINKHALLTRDQEVELAMKFKNSGDIEAAHKLVTSNLRFVVKIAHEYRGYGLRLLDLIQEGNIGLMMAVKKFDPSRGYRLISYAVWWIRAYMQSFILNSWSLVKVGTTQAQRKLFYKLRSAQKTISQSKADSHEHASASSEEIALMLGVEASEVAEMELRLSQRDFSLDSETSEDGKLSFINILEDKTDNQEAQLMDSETHHLLQEQVSRVLSVLNEKERYIVENRLMADEPLTLREIGEKFNVSRERARQIESNVIKKVKKLIPPSFAHAI